MGELLGFWGGVCYVELICTKNCLLFNCDAFMRFNACF